MEVKVELGLSKGLENVMNRLISAIEGVGPGGKSTEEDSIVLNNVEEKTAEPVTKVEAVSDVEMVSTVEDAPVEDEEINYPALRKEIKKLGIKLVQAKKQSEVKALTAKYGYTKMDELPDNKLIQYLEDLKEFQNG